MSASSDPKSVLIAMPMNVRLGSLHTVIPASAAMSFASSAAVVGSGRTAAVAAEDEDDANLDLPEFVSLLNGDRVAVGDRKEFKFIGNYHSVDTHPDRCLDLNNREVYTDCLSRQCKYKLPVPWKFHEWKDFCECVFSFALPSESRLMHDFLLSQKDGAGTFFSARANTSDSSTEGSVSRLQVGDRFRDIEMVVTKSQIARAMNIPTDMANHNGFHLIPIHIEVVGVDSTFPVTLTADLSTTRANRTPAEGGFKLWSRKKAIRSAIVRSGVSSSSSSSNSVVSTANDDSVVTGYVIEPNAKTVSAEKVVYYAPEELNHPNFPRWISANVPHLIAAFNSLKLVQNDSIAAWIVKCPPVSAEPQSLSESNVMFWVVAAHFDEIVKRTVEFGLKCSRPVDFFNQVTVSSTNEPCIWVVKSVIEDFLRDRQKAYNKDELLMNINMAKLTVRPLHGQAGWDDLVAISNSRRDNAFVPAPALDDTNVARLRVSVRMVAHLYTDHVAMMPTS
jgi:hypothetical protein